MQRIYPVAGAIALVNLAVETSLSSQNQAEMESDDEDNEDDNPNHCALCPMGASIESLVISVHVKLYGWNVAFQSCHNWYHEAFYLRLKEKRKEKHAL